MGKITFLTLLICLASVIGCKQRPAGMPQDKTDIEGGIRKNIPVFDRLVLQTQLKAIGDAYALIAAENRAPKDIEDLAQYIENRKITQAVKDGVYVVFFGVNYNQLSGDTILAYQQEANADGERVVLTTSGVLVMSAKAFEAAPKAKSK